MRELDKRPEPAVQQWVEVWEHNGKMWCNTYRLSGGVEEMYDPVKDLWRKPDIRGDRVKGTHYYTV